MIEKKLKEDLIKENTATVIIPNYNGMPYIEDCLSTLFKNDKIAEVIIVDNHSQDGSAQWIAEHYPQVNLLCLKENKGFSAAVNIGIKKAKTEFVILLNNDTRVDAGFVPALIHIMHHSERIFSASARMMDLSRPEIIDDAGDFYCALGWAYARGKGKASANYLKKCDVFSACGGAAIYRKSIMEEIGYFDENHFAYLEDVDIGYRARLYGYRNVYTPDAIVYHAGSASSGSRYNQFKTKLTSRNSIYLIYKNMPLLQIILNMPFLIVGFLLKILFFIRKGMGAEYIKGLWAGVVLSAGDRGRGNKVKFKPARLGTYVRLEWQLLKNMLGRIIY